MEEVEEWVDQKDPNKPKRALSSYMYFNQQRRVALIEENPSMQPKMVELTKIVAAEWNAMDDEAKKPFVELAEEDKIRYAKQMKRTCCSRSCGWSRSASGSPLWRQILPKKVVIRRGRVMRPPPPWRHPSSQWRSRCRHARSPSGAEAGTCWGRRI